MMPRHFPRLPCAIQQHQAHQAAMKQNQSRAQAQQPLLPPSQMQPRGVNGIGPQRGFPPNGVIPNGIPGNGQPPPPTAFAGGPLGQPNGILPGPPPPGMQPYMQGRPPMVGQPRPPNGGAPFQSPTMAHSPPNPGQQPQPPPQHAPPMGQLPPPHRGGMLPPGHQGMNPGQQTPTPMYQGLAGRPPSRTSTPQSGGMMASPSMANRQPGNDPRQEMNLTNEMQSIPQNLLHIIKNEVGLGAKDPQSLTFQDKVRLYAFFLISN